MSASLKILYVLNIRICSFFISALCGVYACIHYACLCVRVHVQSWGSTQVAVEAQGGYQVSHFPPFWWGRVSPQNSELADVGQSSSPACSGGDAQHPSLVCCDYRWPPMLTWLGFYLCPVDLNSGLRLELKSFPLSLLSPQHWETRLNRWRENKKTG